MPKLKGVLLSGGTYERNWTVPKKISPFPAAYTRPYTSTRSHQNQGDHFVQSFQPQISLSCRQMIPECHFPTLIPIAHSQATVTGTSNISGGYEVLFNDY